MYSGYFDEAVAISLTATARNMLTPGPITTDSATRSVSSNSCTGGQPSEITSSLVYEQLIAGDVKRRVSADPVDRLAPVRRP